MNCIRITQSAVAGLLLAAVLASCTPRADSPDPSLSANTNAGAPHPLQGSAGSLHVDDGGRGGIPVLFVHSFAGSSAHWRAQLEHLRATRRAVALDLRGHGESAAPADTGGYVVDSLASDIGAAADGLGLDRFVLVGHSMGGSAAVAYAGAHPERVAGLVLVGAPGKTPAAQRAQVMAGMRADYAKTSEPYWTQLLTHAQPAVAAQVRGDMQRLPPQTGIAIIDAIFAYDPTAHLGAYPGPKLLIENSDAEPPGSLRALAPGVPVKVIEGTSHWMQMDKPAEFNAALDEFLAGVK